MEVYRVTGPSHVNANKPGVNIVLRDSLIKCFQTNNLITEEVLACERRDNALREALLSCQTGLDIDGGVVLFNDDIECAR